MAKKVLLVNEKGEIITPFIDGQLSYIDEDEVEVVNLQVSATYLPYAAEPA